MNISCVETCIEYETSDKVVNSWCKNNATCKLRKENKRDVCATHVMPVC
jgi:hypothetical protein